MADSLVIPPKFQKIMDCDASVQADDLVYEDYTLVNTCIAISTNDMPTPIIGIVKKKITSTSCLVFLGGVYDYTISAGKLWVSSSGDLTTTFPLTGNSQCFGVSFGDGKIYVNPEKQMLVR